ncbi:MAG: hypothetical protein ACRD47_05865 [Nitrososphaeraceae archaeon]
MTTTLRVLGISIFVTIIFLMLKIRPNRLRLSDYFIALSVFTLLSTNNIKLSEMSSITYSKGDITMSRITAADPIINIEL